MAWIESHQTLREHPKTYALADALGVCVPQAVGHLHFIWWWCVDYAPEGRLDPKDPRKIARAGGWMGEATKFVQALTKAGFLDLGADGLVVHDWEQFQYHYHLLIDKKDRQREQARERMRKKRAESNGSQNVTRNKSERSPNVTQCSPPTVPDSTVPTVPDQPKKGPPPPPTPKPEVVIPEDLKASEAEVRDWLAFKREKGQTYKAKGLEALWRRFREIPAARRRAAVDHSMANNYQGLFEPKGGPDGKTSNGFRADGKDGRAPADPHAVVL